MNLVVKIEDISDDEEFVFDLSEKPDCFDIDPEEGVLKQDVRVQGSLSKVGREFFLKGSVSSEIELTCSRCLEPLIYPIRAKLESHYIPGPDGKAGELDTDLELHASDIEVEYYTDDRIDLTQAVYDQMILSLPLVRLCQEECKGICSHCGGNRNQKDCQCSEEGEIDPRMAVLRSLKDKLK
ncbi:MAG: DUF177 domain-containing protein [Nitrospinota bacterium]|nr:DUF177 domain-containing protein [Nitrospinota bacterium]